MNHQNIQHLKFRGRHSCTDLDTIEKEFTVVLLWNPTVQVDFFRNSSNTPCTLIDLVIKSDVKQREFNFSKFLEYNRNILTSTACKSWNVRNVEFNKLDYQRTKTRAVSSEVLEYTKNKQVIWLSQLPRKITSETISISAEKLLIMDADTEFISENINISADAILVIALTTPPVNKDMTTLTVIGSKASKITFDRRINEVINSKSLLVQVKKSKSIYGTLFPPADNEEFSQNLKYIRMESILINSYATEYLSYNNRYLDLIVYWEPDYGKVIIDERWEIEKITTIVLAKFFTNECMRTKDQIREKFPSVKNFKNVGEYIEKCNVKHAPPLLVQGLEKLSLTIPTIFEIFFLRYNEFGSNSPDFRVIKEMLLERCIAFLKKLSNGDYSSLFDSQILLENIDPLLHHLGCHLDESGLEKKICYFLEEKSLTNSIDFQALFNKFFIPFNSLMQNPLTKQLLFENLLTGDISAYDEKRELASVGNYSNAARSLVQHTFLQGAKIIFKEITKTAAKEGAKEVVKTGFKEGVKGLALNFVKGISLPLAIGMSVVEVTINVIALHVNSGYYEVVLEY